MPRKTYRAEEIVGLLRDMELMNGKGKSFLRRDLAEMMQYSKTTRGKSSFYAFWLT
ncbi:hypothetical protein SDC9_62554 [bioreactor metagenome]|uniref:Uncharacterized protein n=1 Tax=bioreactor metagenome TaxID=1076179 RepID=A0A644XKA3_9ZZZZ